MVEQVRRVMAPYIRMIRMSIARGVIRLVNDGLKAQELQVGLLADEVRDGIERFQEYGFSSNPFPGAEVVVVFVGGSRDHGIAVACEDRRYRKRDLEPGEAAMYDDQGQAVHLKRGKIIHLDGCDQALIDATVSHQVNSPAINLGGDRGGLYYLCDERLIAWIANHTHDGGPAPDQSLTVADVCTSVTKAK